MPFLLETNRNDKDMVKTCRLPFFEEILPPQVGKKRCHFDSSETSTQLPDRKRHAGLSPIPVVTRVGEVEIVGSLGAGLEVGPDRAILNHRPLINPNDIRSPTIPSSQGRCDSIQSDADADEIWTNGEEEFSINYT